jgi:hypothetical protein
MVSLQNGWGSTKDLNFIPSFHLHSGYWHPPAHLARGGCSQGGGAISPRQGPPGKAV